MRYEMSPQGLRDAIKRLRWHLLANQLMQRHWQTTGSPACSPSRFFCNLVSPLGQGRLTWAQMG